MSRLISPPVLSCPRVHSHTGRDGNSPIGVMTNIVAGGDSDWSSSDFRLGSLIANIKEEVIDDHQSHFVLELRVAMRPMQSGLPNTLFISACYPNGNA